MFKFNLKVELTILCMYFSIFYRRRVHLGFRFMFSMLSDMFWTCDT